MQKDSANSSNNLLSLENITKLAPIFTVSILAISITYDSAYLLALGLTLFDIPSSISEHVRSALLWAPMLLVMSMFIGAMFISFINFVDEKNSSIKNKNNDGQKEWQKIIFTVLIILLVLLLIYISFLEKTVLPLLLAIPLLWLRTVLDLIELFIFKKINSSVPLLLLIFNASFAIYFWFNWVCFWIQIN